MEIQPILNAVESAVISAAREEWNRLSGNTLDADRYVYVVRSVEKSLGAMRDLQAGVMPDYSEWDALLYAAWYQPKQINLAYSVLRALRQSWTIGGEKWWDGDIFGIANGRLSVIDFGCGSLAMQFAIAIAAADSISQGSGVSEIRIDSYDTSPAMIWVGQRIWGEFVHRMTLFHPQHPICGVFDIIQHESHIDLASLPEPANTPYLLTALHAAYENTADEVKDALGTLVSKYAPAGLLLTTQSAKANVLNRATLINDDQRYVRLPADGTSVKAQFDGDLESLTEWRHSLCYELLAQSRFLADMGINTSFVRNYLTVLPANWEYPTPAIRVYARRDIDRIFPEDDPPR